MPIQNEDQLRSRYDHFLQTADALGAQLYHLCCTDCDFITDDRERLTWDNGDLVCVYCWRRREWIRDEVQEILEFIPSWGLESRQPKEMRK